MKGPSVMSLVRRLNRKDPHDQTSAPRESPAGKEPRASVTTT